MSITQLSQPFVTAFAYLFGGARITRHRWLDVLCWLTVAVLATIPSLLTLALAALISAVLLKLRKRPITGTPVTA